MACLEKKEYHSTQINELTDKQTNDRSRLKHRPRIRDNDSKRQKRKKKKIARVSKLKFSIRQTDIYFYVYVMYVCAFASVIFACLFIQLLSYNLQKIF